MASVSGSWEVRFVDTHVDESEGRPSSKFIVGYKHLQ